MRYHKIADETVRRLPFYLRRLLSLSEQNQANISGRDLADLLGVKPWQIRKDFSYFGAFGTPGIGYNIKKLIAIIAVPWDKAQQTADTLVKTGIKGILSFSPCYIRVPGKVKVITIDIAMDLARLPYYMPAS